MENILTVNGIIPGEMVGLSELSTADITQAWKTKKLEKKVEKEEKKNEKDFLRIREQLIEKVFKYSPEEFEQLIQSAEQFKNDTKDVVSESDIVKMKLSVAKGALGTEKANMRDRKADLISYAKSVGTVGLGILGLSLPFGPLMVATGTLAMGTFKLARSLHFKNKAQKGNISDSLAKEMDSLDAINGLLQHIEQFMNDIIKDKDMLIAKKREISDKEFDQFLNNYLNQKYELLQDVGAIQYLKEMGLDPMSQMSNSSNSQVENVNMSTETESQNSQDERQENTASNEMVNSQILEELGQTEDIDDLKENLTNDILANIRAKQEQDNLVKLSDDSAEMGE